MERFKQFVLGHFEKILIGLILLGAVAGMYFIQEKSITFNFYYLPVLVAGYFLGRRMGVLTAIFSILVVLLSAFIFPERFFGHQDLLQSIAQFLSWGGFLILTSVAVGTLFEQNERRMQELKSAYIGILEILSKYLESTDRYTKGHSVRVSELAMEIAIAMELPRAQVENIRVAGLLHDIGKIEVSGEILLKAAELSTEERELIDAHAEKGAHILLAVGAVLKDVVPIVITHHQYFVNTLDVNHRDIPAVPLGARVVAVADAFDAMTTDRPYRKGKPPWEALEQINANSGKQFDPEVVRAFKRVVGERIEMT